VPRPAEVCDRLAAILGPPREFECADGSHGSRSGVDCAAAPAFDVPADCAVSVSEVETCYREIAALPDCTPDPGGFFGSMLAVMSGPACAPMAACSPPASTSAGPARDASGALTAAGLEAMNEATAASTGTYEETLASLVETYGEPHRAADDGERWYARDGEDCLVFALTRAPDGTHASGMVVPMPPSSCDGH
jgi:hypothetical protein